MPIPQPEIVPLDDHSDDYRQAYNELQISTCLRKPETFEDGLCCILEGRFKGIPFTFDDRLAFRDGEVTLWGGINGHGKSLLTGQLAMLLADAGQKSCIISLEMEAKRTLFRMCRQFVGHWPKTYDEIKRFLARYNESLLLFDYVGALDIDVLLGAIVVAAQQRFCRHFFIDNLMRCVVGEDDYNAQKDFVQELCSMARRLGVHIHLVHHVRKGKDEDEEIGKFSFKGSGAIVDQVDNAILIQRNRKKEKRREEGILTPTEDTEEGDSILRIVKQRNGDFEGNRLLWFNSNAAAFCADSNRLTPWQRTVQ